VSAAQKERNLASEPTILAGEPEITVIRPRRGWQAVDFGELWRDRELLYFLVWRDVKVRYKQTVLGAAWAVLQPVLEMLIFTLIFGRLANLPSENVPYSLFVFAALMPWTFFQNAVSQSGTSLVSQASVLTKIYFPRLFVPSASVGASLVDFGLSFGVYAIIMLWHGMVPGVTILLIPLLIVLTVLTALGTGCLLASLAVTYRDFKFVIPFLMRIWMFVTPVVWSMELIPGRFEKIRWLLALNPMCGIVQGFRSALLDKPVPWSLVGTSAVVAVAIFVFGLYNFRRMERRFADIA
jgi:lipopolysaccharide transport system permease protein